MYWFPPPTKLPVVIWPAQCVESDVKTQNKLKTCRFPGTFAQTFAHCVWITTWADSLAGVETKSFFYLYRLVFKSGLVGMRKCIGPWGGQCTAVQVPRLSTPPKTVQTRGFSTNHPIKHGRIISMKSQSKFPKMRKKYAINAFSFFKFVVFFPII